MRLQSKMLAQKRSSGSERFRLVKRAELSNTVLELCRGEKTSVENERFRLVKRAEPSNAVLELCRGEKRSAEDELFCNFVEKWSKTYPRFSKFKDECNIAHFTYLQFPPQVQRMIYTPNWILCVNDT